MLRNNCFRIALFQVMLISGLFLLFACGPMPTNPQQDDETTSLLETQQNPAPSTEGNTIQMTPTLPTPAEPALQRLIEKATNDLAQRLAVSANDVALLEATSVVWPDGSLGCPQEGMEYAQALVPGYLIRLKSGEQEFEYHASRGTTVIFCENPMPPIPGTPADT